MYIDKDDLITHFFRVFEIEPIPIKSYGNWLIKGSIAENDKGEKVVYPEISDRKLLEMICIIVQSKALLPIFVSENIENLKDEIIQMTIDAETKFKHNNKIDFKHQIQELFKENQ